MKACPDFLARIGETRERAYLIAELRIERLLTQILPAVDPHAVLCAPIDGDALNAWTQQWRPHHRVSQPGGWRWPEQCQAFRNVYNRFELALWHGDSLCGLAIGRPSRGRQALSVHLLEGCPAPHPLKGAVRFCIMEAAQAYAEELECRELRLIRPLPDVLPYYERMGFTLAKGMTRRPYCARLVRQ